MYRASGSLAWFVALAALTVCSVAAGATPDPEQGKALLTQRGCIACHSLDGTPRQGPTLLGVAGKTRRVFTQEKLREVVADEAYLRRSILEPNHDVLEGYAAGAMPKLPFTEEDAGHMAAAIVRLDVEPVQQDKRDTTFVRLGLSVFMFVAMHLFLSSLPMRRRFEPMLGANRYRAVFALIILGLLLWMIEAYHAAPYVEVWRAPPWTRWIPVLTMPISVLFLLAGLTTKNPTNYGQESAVTLEPQGMVRISRHAVLWAFVFWGITHAIPNGDVASLMLFGGLVFLCFAGMLHIDYRCNRRLGEAWTTFAAKTSIIPFVRGNVLASLREVGAVRIVASFVGYFALLYIHEWLIGVSALP